MRKLIHRRAKVTVIYKSGAKAQFRAREFSFSQDARGRRKATWEGCYPTPMLLGMDEVAAIYEGHV